MKRVLLSAFACDPEKGSEAANGWNWALGLAEKGYYVVCITRKIHSEAIDRYPITKNLQFVYVDLGMLEKLYSFSQASMYLYYLIWQKRAQRIAYKLHKKSSFDIVHHVTWGSIQLGSFMYKLQAPLIFGPAGGGQKAPDEYKEYFFHHWNSEKKRNVVGEFLEKFNPAFKNMIKSSEHILVANNDTLKTVNKFRSSNVYKTFDFALPGNFFPDTIDEYRSIQSELKLLWVGRFMPRKGLFLVLDVMNNLKFRKDIKLTIVGDGELKDSVEKYIKKHCLEETVSLVGRIPYETVKSFYRSHDAFFFTSLRDSCPVQLMEAMAYGLPVITIDLHGQSEIVNDITGIKVPLSGIKQTISDLTDAIVTLKSNDDLFNEKRHSAFQFAKMNSWDFKISEITSKYYP